MTLPAVRRAMPGRFARVVAAAWVGCAAIPVGPALAHPSAEERRSVIEERERESAKEATGQRDARGWFERGRLLAEAGDAAGALRAFDAAVELDPALPGLERSRAEACLAAGVPDRGLEAIDRHLRSSPADPRGLVLRARLLASLGRHGDAVQTWNRLFALPVRPEPDHAIERARSSVAAGDVASAIRGLDEARARMGAVPAIDHLAVDLEVRRGDFDGALRRIERAASGRAPRGTWELRRAEVLEAAGRTEESRAAYAAAQSDLRARAARGRAVPADLEGRASAGLARTGAGAAPGEAVPAGAPAAASPSPSAGH